MQITIYLPSASAGVPVTASPMSAVLGAAKDEGSVCSTYNSLRSGQNTI